MVAVRREIRVRDVLPESEIALPQAIEGIPEHQKTPRPGPHETLRMPG